ncbi:RNA-directed DNA polymerase, eukaryota, reverse transcriptase zinc-binding domain protein [Tanacetum coccineum]
MLHGLLINWSSSAIETSRNRVNGEYRDDKKDVFSIRNHPLILQKWNPNVDLLKEDVGNVLVWVKLHGVTVTEFSEDGLSAISIKLELKDNIIVAMPKITREGYYTCTICVEYEWKPPRCSCCKVFGHTQEECPKNIGLGVAKNLKKPSQTSQGVPCTLESATFFHSTFSTNYVSLVHDVLFQ